MAGVVKGFGCRPVVTYPRVMRAGVRKPPRKEPAGAGWTASGLWGFDGAAAWVGDTVERRRRFAGEGMAVEEILKRFPPIEVVVRPKRAYSNLIHGITEMNVRIPT